MLQKSLAAATEDTEVWMCVALGEGAKEGHSRARAQDTKETERRQRDAQKIRPTHGPVE